MSDEWKEVKRKKVHRKPRKQLVVKKVTKTPEIVHKYDSEPEESFMEIPWCDYDSDSDSAMDSGLMGPWLLPDPWWA